MLKAWDEKQISDRSALSRTQQEASTLAERLNGEVRAIQSAIDLGRNTRTSREAIAQRFPTLEAVAAISTAQSAPEGSALRSGSAVAQRLLDAGLSVGMTGTQEIVIVSASPDARSMFAIAPAEALIPKPVGARRFTLSGATVVGVGDSRLQSAADVGHRGLPEIQNGALRTATGCAPLAGSDLSVCSTAEVPLFGRDDFLRLIIYALLFAAPALAILGLANRVTLKPETEDSLTVAEGGNSQPTLEPILLEARAGTWRWTPDHDVLEIDAIAAQLLGLGRSELTIRRHDLLSCAARPYHGELSDAFKSAQQTGQLQTIFAIEGAKGTFAELRGGQITSPVDQGPKVIGGLLFDVSRAKQSDLKLRHAEERLRQAIDGFSGPFALWDAKQRLVFWNRSFELDFGLQDQLRAGVAQETVWLSRAAAVRRERIVNDDNSTTLLELHDRRWLKIVEREIPDQGYITLGLDVTENVRNEDLLKQQKKALKKVVTELEQSEGKNRELARKYQEEKLKAEHAANTKSAFLANMSHELRTPLNAINGFSEMLVNELFGPLGDDRYNSYAGDILTAGRHLLDLINDILDMSKIEAGKMTVNLQPIDPVDPVDAAVRMVRPKADEKAIVLSLDAEEDLPNVDADHRAMRQMVLNLVSNAIKFTPEKGRVHVSVRTREDQICIAVTDTGMGISKEDLQRLGKPFEQAKQGSDSPQKGTGLGLALTKSFAELHGGRLAMASELGKGTRVSIYLPIPSDASQTGRGAVSADAPQLASETKALS
ncbi:MAG: ATP-binding protein [Pseudomonadota bacterium]